MGSNPSAPRDADGPPRGRRRGRRPDPTVDARIRQAVTSLLLERGFDLTMDDVANRARVGRASVFRRYATKRHMILDATAGLTDLQLTDPDTGSLREDLSAVLSQVVDFLADDRLRNLSRLLFAEAGSDTAVADLVRAAMRRRIQRLHGIFDRAVTRGELAPDADLDLVVDLLTGLCVYRVLARLPPPSREEVPRLVRLVLNGFTAGRPPPAVS